LADKDGDNSRPCAATLNLGRAAALVRGLVEGGIRHAVISPGSRSTPLVIAFNSCPNVTLHILPDERSAAFLALGLARSTGSAAAVVCTSGSAAANWYPAVVEASMDDVPMVLVSADRPPELRDRGANQTIDQRHLYGVYPRQFIDLSPPEPHPDDTETAFIAGLDACTSAHSNMPGPVHINVAFSEPLVPPANYVEPDWPEPEGKAFVLPAIPPIEMDLADFVSDITGKRGLIVCGRSVYPDGFGFAIAKLAERLSSPIIADPLSGLRWGPHERQHFASSADVFLRSEDLRENFRPDWAIQFGAAPTSGPVLKLLSEIGPGLTLVSDRDRWADPSGTSGRKITADAHAMVQALLDMGIRHEDPDWLQNWYEMNRIGQELSWRAAVCPPEAALVAAIEKSLSPTARLFIGNSTVIRAFDTFAAGRNETLVVYGNRGASGIDGNVSTILGIASDPGGPVVGVIGDLTLFHDMNGLLAARNLNATLIVINNGGGAIFDLLPQRNMADFERLWLTPTGLEIERIASLYDLHYEKATSIEQLERAIADSISRTGVDVIEFPVDRQDSTDRLQRMWAEAKKLVIDNEQTRSS